jgi:hypothetical protein
LKRAAPENNRPILRDTINLSLHFRLLRPPNS